MNKWIWAGLAYLIGIPVLALMLHVPFIHAVDTLPLPAVEQADLSWDEQAERALGLAQGQGQFLTESEWAAHQRTLWTMVPEAQEQYRDGVRAEIAAREKGRIADSSVRG